MSDLETPQFGDVASDLAALARDLGFVPRLVDRVSNLNRRVKESDLLAGDVREMALSACESELRVIKALNSLIFVLRNVVPATTSSNAPMQALLDAEQQLNAAEARIAKAIDQVIARLVSGEPPA